MRLLDPRRESSPIRTIAQLAAQRKWAMLADIIHDGDSYLALEYALLWAQDPVPLTDCLLKKPQRLSEHQQLALLVAQPGVDRLLETLRLMTVTLPFSERADIAGMAAFELLRRGELAGAEAVSHSYFRNASAHRILFECWAYDTRHDPPEGSPEYMRRLFSVLVAYRHASWSDVVQGLKSYELGPGSSPLVFGQVRESVGDRCLYYGCVVSGSGNAIPALVVAKDSAEAEMMVSAVSPDPGSVAVACVYSVAAARSGYCAFFPVDRDDFSGMTRLRSLLYQQPTLCSLRSSETNWALVPPFFRRLFALGPSIGVPVRDHFDIVESGS